MLSELKIVAVFLLWVFLPSGIVAVIRFHMDHPILNLLMIPALLCTLWGLRKLGALRGSKET